MIPPAIGAEIYAPTLVFGSEGNGSGQFGGILTGPWGISVDAEGIIYVADTDNNRIEVFHPNGTLLDSWVTDPVYGIKTPHGVVASPDHSSVHVADSSQSRVLKYDRFGNLLDHWYVSPAPGGVQTPSYPMGIARGHDERVWVTELTYGQGIVRVYSPGGDEVWSFFCNDPRGIAVAGSDNVYVASGSGGYIRRYTQQGRYLMQFGEPGSGPGQFDHPNGVAVDAAGNVYVADSGNHRVQKFDSGGHYITSFGSRGSGAGQFEYPEGVAVDASGNVYVTDRNCRVQRFACQNPDPVSLPGPSYRFSSWRGEAPYGIQFGDGSSGNPTSWLWEFGDGTTSTEQNPYHIFRTPGTFSPRLTVRNAAGGAFVTLGDQKIVITESSYRFVRSFGSVGTGAGQLQWPRGLALNWDGELYVVDRGTHRVTAFSPAGEYLFSFGREGTWSNYTNPAVDELLGPCAVATWLGTVYVGDQDYHRVKVFSGNGAALGQFRPRGDRLKALAISSDGSLFVVCDGAKTIERYDFTGEYAASFSTVPPGADAATYAGTPLAVACDPQGDVWLLDPGSETMMVRQYGANGTFLSGWGRRGTAPGELDLSPYAQFQAIAVDRSGDVYVTGEDSSISRFAPNGTFITKFGSPGSAEGQVGSPVALAVDDTNCVYVASWDGRVQEFASAGPATPTPTPTVTVTATPTYTVNETPTPTPAPTPVPVPPATAPPRDLDGDDTYEDVNGNGRADFADVVLYFNRMTWIAGNEPVSAFDCNGNGRIDFADVVWLFNHL